MFLEKIESLKASIDQKKADAQAFVMLAEEDDKRDLTSEESASIDLILDKEIPELVNSLERFEKLAAHSETANRGNVELNLTETPDSTRSNIIVPAKARVHAKLKAFTGPTAEVDAYVSGRFLLATLGQHQESQDWCNEHGIDIMYNAMTTTDNAMAGFTVPTEMEVSIVALREQFGVFRQNASIESMSSDVKQISRPIGGMTAEFVGEGVAASFSDSQWKQIELIARKLMALAKMSKELSVDSVISVADQVARDIAHAFALKEDQCGFNGDGTATFGGITGLINKILASSTYVALAGNTAFSTLDLADFESMAGQLPQYAEAGARWYISKQGYWASMARLQDAAGGNNKTDIAGSPISQFLGYPVVISQVMNSTLTAQTTTDGLCYLGDLAMSATLADRTGVSVETSTDFLFTTDQIAIKGTERFGINVHEFGSASGDAGPIIMLATPGA